MRRWEESNVFSQSENQTFAHLWYKIGGVIYRLPTPLSLGGGGQLGTLYSTVHTSICTLYSTLCLGGGGQLGTLYSTYEYMYSRYTGTVLSEQHTSIYIIAKLHTKNAKKNPKKNLSLKQISCCPQIEYVCPKNIFWLPNLFTFFL